jgi:hypothetical protein
MKKWKDQVVLEIKMLTSVIVGSVLMKMIV